MTEICMLIPTHSSKESWQVTLKVLCCDNCIRDSVFGLSFRIINKFKVINVYLKYHKYPRSHAINEPYSLLVRTLISFLVPYMLDLLPYYLSIANGAGGVGIFELLVFQCFV